MGKDHLKRLAAPRTWTIKRKANTFVTRPKPGKPLALAMPLNHVMRELLPNKGNTTKETRYILFHSDVLINGKKVTDHRRPIAFMDVISFPATKEHFMITLTKKGRLGAVAIDAKQADSRLAKIRGKTRRAGKFQINCYDGSNITIDKNDYKTGDTLVLKGGKVAKHLPLTKGASIILTGGRHLAKTGTVKEIDGRTIYFSSEDGEHSTARRHAFVVGEKTPEVTLR